MAVRRAGFGNRRVACAVFNLERSSDRSRTMNMEKVRVREPVNNGRRNKRTFSRDQLATVLDANAQEALLLRHQTASWPSAEELKPMSRSTFSHTFEEKITASTRSTNASRQECTQGGQVLEHPNARVLGHRPHDVYDVGPHVLASLGRRGVQELSNRPW